MLSELSHLEKDVEREESLSQQPGSGRCKRNGCRSRNGRFPQEEIWVGHKLSFSQLAVLINSGTTIHFSSNIHSELVS